MPPGALLMPAGQACCQLGSVLLSSGSQVSLQVCRGACAFLPHLHSSQIRPTHSSRRLVIPKGHAACKAFMQPAWTTGIWSASYPSAPVRICLWSERCSQSLNSLACRLCSQVCHHLCQHRCITAGHASFRAASSFKLQLAPLLQARQQLGVLTLQALVCCSPECCLALELCQLFSRRLRLQSSLPQLLHLQAQATAVLSGDGRSLWHKLVLGCCQVHKGTLCLQTGLQKLLHLQTHQSSGVGLKQSGLQQVLTASMQALHHTALAFRASCNCPICGHALGCAPALNATLDDASRT